MALTLRFAGRLWEYPGEAPWVFVTLPAEDADRVTERAPRRRGFGAVKVSATIGASTWQTSLFPDNASASFLLPVKKAIRDQENVHPGDVVDVTLRIVTD